MARVKSTTKSNTKNKGTVHTMVDTKNIASLDEIYQANPHISENVIRILLVNLETSIHMFPMPERNHKKLGIVSDTDLIKGVKASDMMPIWTQANCLFAGTNHPEHGYIKETATRLDLEHNKLSYTQATRKLLGMDKRKDNEKGLQTFHVCSCYWLTDETVEKLNKLNEPSTDTETKPKPNTEKEPILATPQDTETKPKSKAKNNAELQKAREKFMALKENRDTLADILGDDNAEVLRIDKDIEKLKKAVSKLASNMKS